MQMNLNSSMELTNFDKIYFLASNFKLINMEKLLSGVFDEMSQSPSVKYVGELNKTDIML